MVGKASAQRAGFDEPCGAGIQLGAWATGIDRMRGHPPPLGFTTHNWHQFKLDALALLRNHGNRLATLGWTTLDLFGLHKTVPAVRVDASGLVRFIHGSTITEVTAHTAIIRRPTGSVLTYRRTDPQPDTVPAWELHNHQQKGTTNG
jgi:hypothetical protein